MRILFISDNYPPEVNAIATRVSERARYWIEEGHQLTVITCAPNFPQGRLYDGYRNHWYHEEDSKGVRVVRVKSFIAPNRGVYLRILDHLSFMMASFIAGLVQPRPDVVVATSPPLFVAVSGWAISAIRRLPFVFELADLWPGFFPAVGIMKRGALFRALEKLELFLYRRSRAVVALTNSFKNDLVKRTIDPAKIEVVRNGVELARYRPQARDEELTRVLGLKNEFVVGYIGTHGMAQGLSNVIEAAALLDEDAGIRFLFVGDGAERKHLIELSESRGLSNVSFLPPRPKDEMPRYWSLCDAALIHLKDAPSFAGIIPSKVFEAMGMGLPLIIVTPRGEVSELVLQEGTGTWVPAGDPTALARAVRDLSVNRSQLDTFARRSREAARHHTRRRQAEEMLSVLESAAIRGA